MSAGTVVEQPPELSRVGSHNHVLGTPSVEWAGRSLRVPRRQPLALLHRLGVRLEAVPRDELCFLFWLNSPDLVARRSLSHLLTRLWLAMPVPRCCYCRQSGDRKEGAP